MSRAIIVRYGELFLKGKNKGFFENTLIKNIRNAIKDFEGNAYKITGRIIIEEYDVKNEKSILNKVLKVFGVHSASVADVVPSKLEEIENVVRNIDVFTENFRVEANRADKRFPMSSMDLARHLGGIVLSKNNKLKVKLVDPQTTIFVDVRDNKSFVFSNIVKGLGGLPVGTGGRAMLLLSGGIDSPVAGFQIAKRGVELHAIHYHSFPYTSEQAKQKVVTLAKILSEYTGKIKLHVVPFTKIQEEIHKNCDSEYMITIMRRFMMKIAERVAIKNKAQALITGESLGQVASQTMESLTSTNSVVETLPVFRPLISHDKEEIVNIAKKINSFETSILPFEDCCTVFVPEKPIIKPKIDRVIRQENVLDLESLINDAIEGIEVIEI